MQSDPNPKLSTELQWTLVESAIHALLNTAKALGKNDLTLASACLSQVDDDIDQLKELEKHNVII